MLECRRIKRCSATDHQVKGLLAAPKARSEVYFHNCELADEMCAANHNRRAWEINLPVSARRRTSASPDFTALAIKLSYGGLYLSRVVPEARDQFADLIEAQVVLLSEITHLVILVVSGTASVGFADMTLIVWHEATSNEWLSDWLDSV
jgi:hypothetical protein